MTCVFDWANSHEKEGEGRGEEEVRDYELMIFLLRATDDIIEYVLHVWLCIFIYL